MSRPIGNVRSTCILAPRTTTGLLEKELRWPTETVQELALPSHPVHILWSKKK